MALAFIAFVGVIGVSLLSYATTNVRATVSLRQLRSAQFSADGAVDWAINKLRNSPIAGYSSYCTTASNFNPAPTLNGQTVVISCAVNAPGPIPPFDVTLTAKCPGVASACGPASSILLVARVNFTGPALSVVANVTSWSVTT